MLKKYGLWVTWLLFVVILGGYFSVQLFVSEDKSQFLIGDATYGHYQIEMACTNCHSDPFGGKDILQDACEQCHAEDLEAAHDSHPKKKFTDPRNVDRIKIIDARYCISCHTEHQHEQTRAMGVTLPDDYCYHCHVDIGEDRESHKDLAFESCASAGCHNFHDNRALYESFLVENANQDWLHEITNLPVPNAAHLTKNETQAALTSVNAIADKQYLNEKVIHEWSESSHANTGVNCLDCHSDKHSPDSWIEKPGEQQCAGCHDYEFKTYTEGKHGMRMATALKTEFQAISPAESHLEFLDEAKQKHQSCTACHDSHLFDRQKAATEACLTCHSDEHSTAFKSSPHGLIWFSAIEKNQDTSQLVSCASCHMPRMPERKGETKIVRVNHNQNFNLRPNEKMLRSVCMNCHGLGFAINSLADKKLILNNFSGKPTVEIPSIHWALKREE